MFTQNNVTQKINNQKRVKDKQTNATEKPQGSILIAEKNTFKEKKINMVLQFLIKSIVSNKN